MVNLLVAHRGYPTRRVGVGRKGLSSRKEAGRCLGLGGTQDGSQSNNKKEGLETPDVAEQLPENLE